MHFRQIKKLPVKPALLLLLLLAITMLTLSGCGAPPVNKGWSGVAQEGGALFLGDMNGNLIAVSQEKGDRLWSVKLQSVSPRGGISTFIMPAITEAIYGTPAAQGDLVYVGSYVRSGSREASKVYAFNAENGEIRWVYPRAGTFEGAIIGGPVVYQGNVYFGTTSGAVYALDAATGDRKWEYRTGGHIWGIPQILSDTLLIGSFDKNLYALDIATGSEKWRFESDGPIVVKPAVKDSTVYFGTYNRYFYAVDFVTGEKLWDFVPETRKGFWASPVVNGDAVYAPCLDGNVYVLDAASGEDLTSGKPIKLERFVSSSPVLVGDSVIVAASNGRVYDIGTGSNYAETIKELKETVHAPLFAGSDVIYIHSQIPDTLHAITPQGETLWNLLLK